MAKLWITYAWADDVEEDVQFVASTLGPQLDVRIDKWTIKAGVRLWPQIENFISDPNQCDAWAIYATENSLCSGPCQEELNYALDRALRERHTNFPLIGIFPGKIAPDLIPASIRTRLYVSTTDSDWRERVVSAAEGRAPAINKASIEPFSYKVHTSSNGYVLELRPRVGSWFPAVVAIPIREREYVTHVIYGPRNNTTFMPGFVSYSLPPGKDDSGQYWHWLLSHEITPTISMYVHMKNIPSQVIFGPQPGPHYRIEKN